MTTSSMLDNRIGGSRVADNENLVGAMGAPHRALQAGSKAVFQRVPAQVVVVTFASRTGEVHGMTATSVCSLSMDPPSLLASVNRSNRTSQAIQEAGKFGINFLSADYVDLAARLAAPGADKAIPSDMLGPRGDWGIPFLTGSFAAVQCDLDTTIARFTHILMIGRITRTHVVDGKADPLLYIGSVFRGLT